MAPARRRQRASRWPRRSGPVAARAVTVRPRPLPTLTQPISRDADRLGPGDQVTHARQRVVLGRWSTARLVLLNGGVLLATAGVLSGVGPLILVGTMACLVAVVAALMLLADAAMAASFRSDQPTPAARSGGG